MGRLPLLSMLCALWPTFGAACDTALILTVDVSNSVDPGEYRVQADGLADALRDPEVIEAMVQNQAAVAVVQWSGFDRQEVTIPWTRIQSAADVAVLSQQARLMPRAFVLSDTAPAEAVYYSLRLFSQVPDCKRKIIDVSGDGTPNSGGEVRDARRAAEQQGVTINGIAIESMGMAITNFFRGAVITRDGFVMTARTHREYAETLRRKIIRELSRVIG
ncbi:DUF1194 domain-containing protein [Yoonia sp. R2331]|uniref:DUF1194 domain-containing protein n=1 Tax=Yoonia sp. R2331 TaxID=3237238 RepID=UPI0034E45A2B